MENNTPPNHFEKASVYACRLFKQFYNEKKYDLDKCFLKVRNSMSQYYSMVGDDLVWNREILSYLYEYIAYRNNANNANNPNFVLSSKIINLTKKNTKKIKNEINSVGQTYKLDKHIKKVNITHYDYIKIKKTYDEFKKSVEIKSNDISVTLLKIYKQLSLISDVSINTRSMTKSLMYYMFPDLFKKDKRHVFYRVDAKKGYCVLSSKKINLIRVLLEYKFDIKYKEWGLIKRYINTICNKGSESSKICIGKYPYLKLKPVSKIKFNYRSKYVSDFKRIVSSSFSLVDLTEKITKKTFSNIFRNEISHLYKFNAEKNYLALNEYKKMRMCNKIISAIDYPNKNHIYSAIIETVNNYLDNPPKKLGYNIDTCLTIAKNN
ncbi:abundant component of virosome [Goatpox virus]|uniref:Protein OPG067 n=2 Tax=Goatpox virus TaxID=186805 RepID=A0A2Z4XG04_9POXV|nr:RNA polymerase subunit [Goatpox virus FZ]AXA19929.1 RNA polymerase subunit [Goatpox virus]QEJ78735.1 abundant component of virosome [Goatpox virus]QEJ78885.1 abundant component of virosome [Goatpox virus]QOK36473.1 abundant component of virosome [Goatpox virus]